MPKPTQELILTNLRDTITEQIQKEHQVLKERREGFVNDHNEVNAKLQCQLSRRNPRQATALELTSNNPTTHLDHQANIQGLSQTTDMSFDYSQTAFALALWMLDSCSSSLDNSQQLTLRLEPE